jgi:hypothetical protein
MPDRPAAKLAELLEKASPDDRKVIIAWLLESRFGVSAASAEDQWTVKRLRTLQMFGELPSGESQLVTVRLPQELHGQLRNWCGEHGFTMAAVIRGVVERFVSERREATEGDPSA